MVPVARGAAVKVVERSAVVLHAPGLEHPLRLSAAWLLDHARESRHATTLQREFLVSGRERLPQIIDASASGELLNVTWAADKACASPAGVTTHSLAQLDAVSGPAEQGRRRVRWTTGLFAREDAPVVTADEMRSDEGIGRALGLMRAFGALRIDGMPSQMDETRAIALRIGAPRETYYGGMWSTRAAPGESAGVNDTAYLQVGIKPHTDGTYFRDPPGLQVLNCISQAERGGESMVVDSLSVLHALYAEAPHVADFFASTPLPWFSYDTDKRSGHPVLLSTLEPILRLDGSGELETFRFNEYDRGQLPPGDWYDRTFLPNWRAFVEVVNRPEHVETLRLLPGQCLVVDNQRVMHGRLAFEGGVREMIGCYIGRDEYESRLRAFGILDMRG
jgi:alpha-ketoglutarate-dependent taurine dioxygenase